MLFLCRQIVPDTANPAAVTAPAKAGYIQFGVSKDSLDSKGGAVDSSSACWSCAQWLFLWLREWPSVIMGGRIETEKFFKELSTFLEI